MEQQAAHSLPVLRVGVRSAKDRDVGALAVFEVLRAAGAPTEVATVPTRDLGLKDVIQSADDVDEDAFRIPTEIVQAVAHAINGLVQRGDFAYLLELAPPYGYLPLVPWERLLAGVFSRPLLRLPKYDLRPRSELPLRVVIVAGQAPDYPDFSVSNLVSRLVRQWRKVFQPKQVSIEIFVSAGDVTSTRRSLRGLSGAAVLHAPTSEVSSDTRWSEWIGEALRHRAVDIVHLVGHGTFRGEVGAFALPRITNDLPGQLVDANELCLALTRAGAWSLLLSAPEDNYCPAALRDFCHAVTESRPAVVALQQFTTTADADEQAETALRMLYRGQRPRMELPDVTCWLPTASAIFGTPTVPRRSGTTALLRQPDGTSALIPEETTHVLAESDAPAWVASGTRTLEMLQAQLTASGGSPPDAAAIEALENVSKVFNQQVDAYTNSRGRRRPRRTRSSGDSS